MWRGSAAAECRLAALQEGGGAFTHVLGGCADRKGLGFVVEPLLQATFAADDHRIKDAAQRVWRRRGKAIPYGGCVAVCSRLNTFIAAVLEGVRTKLNEMLRGCPVRAGEGTDGGGTWERVCLKL